MLKKMLIVLVITLVIEVVVGSLLLNQYDPTVKMIHGIVGALIGLLSIGVVYSAFRENATIASKMLSVATLLAAVLAYMGGKLTATSYAQGLMLMRISGVTALVLSAIALYTVIKRKK